MLRPFARRGQEASGVDGVREAGVLEFGSRGAECWRSDASRIRHGETGRLAAPWSLEGLTCRKARRVEAPGRCVSA